MKVKVKICGIRKKESALAALQAGADFLGFNFVVSSKRYINPVKAKEIIKILGNKIKIVGVFENESLEKINQLVEFLKLEFVQLHGQESNNFCQKIKAKVIKAFRLSLDFEVNKIKVLMKKYQVDFYLLDKEKEETRRLNLEKVKQLTNDFPIFLAGGLNSDNIEQVLKQIKPYGVDMARGIETNGKEDINKIKNFIKRVKNELS